MNPDRRNGSGDSALIQMIDGAMAEAVRRSGPWLACRPGCTQCCIGPFPITQLDAERLRRGLAGLDERDGARASAVRERARASVARLTPDFPGNPETGILDESEEAEARFETFADDEPCPALDPVTGLCDLYEARPVTCRTFGPPVSCGAGSLGVCELCFQGASDEEIAACEVEIDPGGLEAELIAQLESEGALQGATLVAFALARRQP